MYGVIYQLNKGRNYLETKGSNYLMPKNQLLRKLEIKNSGLILDLETGYIFTTNNTGLTIISSLKNGMSKNEIKNILEEKYDISDGRLDKDLIDFLYQLKSYGWIEDF